MVSVPLTEGNNRNFARGSPTELSFFGFFGQKDRVATRQAGVWIYFYFSYFFRVFSPNPISIIRIVEDSTISVLEYFGYSLANVGLPKAWLGCDSNFVTWIENKYVRCELNQVEKTIEYNQTKTTIESN